MAMVVQHNLTAMNANRTLGITTGQQSKSSEKLSSGYRINRAADDAAGLTISEKMRKQIRGVSRASTNAQDGVSAVQTAEGALTEVHSMLQRMNELAVQSANGTNAQVDRDAIQAEIKQLETEIDRVAETTKFNETYLLKGDPAVQTTVYSYKEVAVDSTFTPKTAGATFYAAGSNTAFADDDAVKAALDAGDEIYTAAPPARQAADEATLTISHASGADGTKNGSHTGYTVDDSVAAGTYTYDNTASAWKDAAGDVVAGITATGGTPANNDTVVITAASVTGKTGDIFAADGTTPLTDAEILAAHLADNTVKFYTTAAAEQPKAKAGVDFDYTPAGKELAKLYDKDGKEIAAHKIDDMIAAGEKIYSDNTHTTEVAEADLGNYTTPATINGTLKLSLHVGADSTDENKISVNIDSMSAAGIGVKDLKVDTEDAATKAIDTISAAIQQVSAQRSALGAVQNRLEHTIANLDNVVENTTAAESRIRDTDMAEEMVEYSKNNILAQAGQSMLAQANQSTQGVLSLLG